jgi:hypothetical protein
VEGRENAPPSEGGDSEKLFSPSRFFPEFLPEWRSSFPLRGGREWKNGGEGGGGGEREREVHAKVVHTQGGGRGGEITEKWTEGTTRAWRESARERARERASERERDLQAKVVEISGGVAKSERQHVELLLEPIVAVCALNKILKSLLNFFKCASTC